MIEVVVGVGGRVYQVRPKDTLWGLKFGAFGAMAIH
jgi:hypothetical protein